MAFFLALPLAGALRRSCYDCHASAQPPPWYGRIAPFSWWIARERPWAQAGVDFSRWKSYSPRQQHLIWKRSLHRVAAGSMPPTIYHTVHPTFSSVELEALQKHLDSLEISRLDGEELLAWPAVEWSGGPVRAVERVADLELKEPLLLEGGLLLVEGRLEAPMGLRGHGAILARGEVVVSGLDQAPGPVWLESLGDVLLRADKPVVWRGHVRSAGRLTTQRVDIEEVPDLRFDLGDVREVTAHFCRDDGELGEYAERLIVARYSSGRYVLWDPEFSTVARAASLSEALEQVERLLGADPALDSGVWNSRFRESWRKLLEELPLSGKPASLSHQRMPSVFESSEWAELATPDQAESP